ncbi:tetratricopeptide repeat protein [Persephonella atlantica]|nr:tetratricopeptide repeat protein [Persephonella atlantica]
MIRMAVLTILLLINGSYALEYQEIKKSYYRSYQYEKTGDYENAIKALMFVYNEYPDGYTVNLRLGWLYYLMKRYANSVFHYKKAIKAAPYSVEAKLGYTLPLLAQKKFSEVESICYQIINTDFYNYYGNLRLSYALRMEKKYETAVKIAQKMLALYPTDINFLMELALSKFSLGKKEEAKKIFLDVLILDPENITAREYLKY